MERRAFSCGAAFGRGVITHYSEASIDMDIEDMLGELSASRARILGKIARVERMMRAWPS